MGETTYMQGTHEQQEQKRDIRGSGRLSQLQHQNQLYEDVGSKPLVEVEIGEQGVRIKASIYMC